MDNAVLADFVPNDSEGPYAHYPTYNAVSQLNYRRFNMDLAFPLANRPRYPLQVLISLRCTAGFPLLSLTRLPTITVN